jgi:hypothetical protein
MKPLNKISSAVLLGIIFLFITLTACNSGKKDQTATGENDTIPKEVVLSPESQQMLKDFPTPFEVTELLEKAQAGYIFNIANPPANVTNYNTEVSRALNLGVYSADLSYSVTYKSIDKTNEFMACTKKLAGDLGITSIYNQEMLDKVKKFNNNKDSLVGMITKTFAETNTFLADNNRNQVAVLITVGGFTESIYLSAALAEFSKDNTKIFALIASQKDNYTKLLSILEAFNADETIKPIFDEVAKLKPIWENYGIESGKKLSKENATAISKLAESVRAVLVK